MRCPKCGFISFDIIETCVKCGKNINTAAEELRGTVASMAAPAFLKAVGAEAVSDAMEEPLDLGGQGEEEAVDLSFYEEPSAEAETETVEMDFGEDSEVEEVAPEIDLGVEEEVVAEPEAVEEEEMGISDLAPSEDAEELLQPEETIEEGPELVAEEGTAGGGLGLEDLKVDGIDLDSTPGVTDSGKVMPSVKTGTALDDFDIDLGDLLTGHKD